MSAYVDTSVLGAYYCPEPASQAADEALRRLKPPVISALSEVEFASLVAKKRRRKELSPRAAQEILDLFGTHLAQGFYRRLSLSTEHYVRARALIGSFRATLHTLDALHLSLAGTEHLALMTADRAMAAAARRHGMKSLLVA